MITSRAKKKTACYELCYYVVMIRANIAEAKAQLSRLLRALQDGERVLICERNVPVAELCRIAPRGAKARALGPGRPGFEIPDAFFEPLKTAEIFEL